MQRDTTYRQTAYDESFEAQETRLAFKDRQSMTAAEEDRLLSQSNEDFTDEEYQVSGFFPYSGR